MVSVLIPLYLLLLLMLLLFMRHAFRIGKHLHWSFLLKQLMAFSNEIFSQKALSYVLERALSRPLFSRFCRCCSSKMAGLFLTVNREADTIDSISVRGLILLFFATSFSFDNILMFSCRRSTFLFRTVRSLTVLSRFSYTSLTPHMAS